MMKKRKNQDDSSDSEMEVDGEEKQDLMEEDVESDEDADVEEEERTGGDNAFMDNFYGLSSSDPSERAQAAHAILHHCLIGSEANTKDAAYALKRLLNGLCSGRAASRQGNASALASFLKVALAGGQLKEIQQEDSNEDPILGYVRHRLIKATDPSTSQGKRKGSEERDYQFGRLFGILSVARSGILLPRGDKSCDSDEILEVSRHFITDLIDLYSHKKWMREPAAHAIGTILNMFYGGEDTQDIASSLVEELVIPKLLQGGVKSFGAEQIAVALTIQSHKQSNLPSPLDKAILSPETIPSIAAVLIETSSVALPRTHLVWDALWVYLTEPENGPLQKKAGSRLGVRQLREKPLVGSSSSQDVIEALVRRVIVEGLLRADSGEGGKKATHEKKALALCLIRNLFGAPFNSSITGATRIQLEAEDLENILTPLIIRQLFMDVMCAGGGSAKKAHTLKPLALQILESIVGSMSQDTSEAGLERRFRMATSFVKCEPRFDNLTKTTTISDLVGLTGAQNGESGSSSIVAVQKFFDFLEEQVMLSDAEEGNMLSYLELLYQSSKRLLRIEAGDDKGTNEFGEFVLKTVERVVGFFMAGAFFDCASFSPDTSTGSGKKSKKGKAKPIAQKNPVAEAAARLNQLCNKRGSATLSYGIRSLLSERYFSLLAEYINASMHSHGGDAGKDSIMLDILSSMCTGWKEMESGGAKPLFPAIESSEDEDGESTNPQEAVFLLCGLAKDLAANSQKNPDDATLRSRKRCATGCAALASTLFLHLLSCGKPEDVMDQDDVTTEDEDDSVDVLEALDELAELTPLILEESNKDEDNVLAGFAELFIGVFSSRLSSGSARRGASPRLIREAVKFAWMGVLAASSTSETTLLDAGVVSVLLSGVGADQNTSEGSDQADEEEEEEDENESDDDMDAEDNSDNELGDFSKAGKILGADEKEEGDSDGAGDDDSTAERQGVDDDEQDVEIDSDKLNSLLEDDSDAEIDVGELEHHEGADAALAKLIRLKQDARKAGRQALEKLEIEKQLRCTLLLEILLAGRSESWASLLRSDMILGMTMPLLAYRKQIETSLLRASGKSAETSAKKGMLDRLTSILKTKLFKLKFASMPLSDSNDKVEYSEALMSSLMEMAKKSTSKDQRACCSAGLACVLKAVSDMESMSKVGAVYVAAVEEWATKRTSGLEVSIFDDLVNHCPSVAQATLVLPIASAATSARSPFLRCECYRLLAALYNPKLNPQSTELEKEAVKKAGESATQAVDSMIAGLKDSEMHKAKRVRDILKASEKLLEFAKASSISLSNVDDLSAAINDVGTKVDNNGVKSAIDKISPMIEALKEEAMNVDTKDDEEEVPEERDTTNDKKKKKKKKKKATGSGDKAKSGDDGGAAPAVAVDASEQQRLLAEQDAAQEVGDANDRKADYTYEELLERVVDLLQANNPDLVEKKRTRIKPPQMQTISSRKCMWVNFQEICSMMQRDPQHVYQFFMTELGTEGSIDGNQRLIIRGRYLPKYIESLLRKYVIEYVTCTMCRSPNTELVKNQATRLYFCKCKDCGSERSVAPIKAGYHATNRADRRAARNAK